MKIIFLGPQGSGKSTQAKMIASYLGLPHIEMGQLLRERGKKIDDLGKEIYRELKLGHLISNETTIDILKSKLDNENFKDGYILDGYPRNRVQMDALESDIDKVFYIKVTDKEAIKRLIKRGRDDDNQDALKKRLEIYHDQTEPLLKEFENKRILIEIDGEKSIEDINKDIKKKINHEN